MALLAKRLYSRLAWLLLTLTVLLTRPFTLATANLIESNLEMLPVRGMRHLQQSVESINTAVCGETEYYCGDADVVLDQAYIALQTPNCSLDSGSAALEGLFTCNV